MPAKSSKARIASENHRTSTKGSTKRVRYKKTWRKPRRSWPRQKMLRGSSRLKLIVSKESWRMLHSRDKLSVQPLARSAPEIRRRTLFWSLCGANSVSWTISLIAPLQVSSTRSASWTSWRSKSSLCVPDIASSSRMWILNNCSTRRSCSSSKRWFRRTRMWTKP